MCSPGTRSDRLRAGCGATQQMMALPWTVRPDLRLPALCLLPGLNAAQLARLSVRPKRLRSSPISMRISAAAILSMPGMVCNNSCAQA